MTKYIKSFKKFYIKENIDIESTMTDTENEIVANFDWSPYNVEILSCHGDIDELTAHITIKLTNGDLLAYHCREVRAKNGPNYSYSFEINNKELTQDEKEILKDEYFGSTGSLVADILLFYKKRMLSKKV